MSFLSGLSRDVRQYIVITGNYWAFTLTDGALRMLVVLHFHELGYSPLSIAFLFLFYEVFGVITNLLGGWLGAKIGLNKTMNIGLLVQVIALGLLLVPSSVLSVAWVMFAQALSGIAKDLNKMSAKSAIKFLVPKEASGKLYQFIALLTGSKNTLKGVGFFAGGALLTLFGFQGAILSMALMLLFVWLLSIANLRQDLGKAHQKPKFSQIFSKSDSINFLSAARLFLFGARDIWFVVALPVFLTSQLQWNHTSVGSFLALWIIGYGLVQTIAPKFTTQNNKQKTDSQTAYFWALILTCLPLLIWLGLKADLNIEWVLTIGLMGFGVVFAINSSFHSYLVVKLAREDGVSLDVGFYYMANALGRLIGTLLSGILFQYWGMEVCLLASAGFILLSAGIIKFLPNHEPVSLKTN